MSEETKVSEQTEEIQEQSNATAVSLSTVYGKKAGMTRIFDEQGNHVPVTVVSLIPNVITQVKTQEKDGYSAYQVSYNEKREKLLTRARKGHLAKANVSGSFARSEVRTDEADQANLGKEVNYEAFAPATYIDVTGTSKGKGFQGVIKRHGFSGGPAAHGSKFHRSPGSIGQCATPGHVFKNKKMPGEMGNKQKTVQT